MKDIIFDIDNTLANGEHRQAFLRSHPRNWAAFNAAMHLDEPHADIIWLLKELWTTGNRILIATGRNEDDREPTEAWLNKHSIPYQNLYMRPAKDYRDDAIIKKEIYEQMKADGYDPFMVFDDRDRVVKMWREIGLRCCQVAPGDF